MPRPDLLSPLESQLSSKKFQQSQKAANMTSTVKQNNEAQAVSLESDAKYRSWRPRKDEKLAFAAQAFCVVCWLHTLSP